jgi:hypothetical protein
VPQQKRAPGALQVDRGRELLDRRAAKASDVGRKGWSPSSASIWWSTYSTDGVSPRVLSQKPQRGRWFALCHSGYHRSSAQAGTQMVQF